MTGGHQHLLQGWPVSPPPLRWRAAGLAAFLGLTAVAALAASPVDPRLTLFGGDQAWPLDLVTTRDAKVAAVSTGESAGIRVQTGHTERWPGVTLSATGGTWNLGPFDHIQVHVENLGPEDVTLFCRVDNPGADGENHCVTGSATLGGRRTGTVRIPLTRTRGDTLGGKLFGMRGYPVIAGGKGTVDPTRVNQVLVFVSEPTADHAFLIKEVAAAGSYTPPTAWVTDATPFIPFIDGLGQYRHKDWPGKAQSPDDLPARAEAEARELAAMPGPAGWDRYGGWADGPEREATGFFRVEKVDGRWWFIDPDGRLFFSHGIDCVRMLDTTAIEERESWFESFPGTDGAFAEFLRPGGCLKGHYAGRSPRCFSFAGANLKRRYGSDWRSVSAARIHLRLRSWGLNTIGMWSDPAVAALKRTPYVDSIGSDNSRRIEGSEGYWGKFPDPFDPAFQAGLSEAMRAKRGGSANDPWCLGYFADNELSWGETSGSLAESALRSPPDQPAKLAFVEDLKTAYGAIGGLNTAWGTQYAAWDDLIRSRTVPDPQRAKADLDRFSGRVADEYFRRVRAAIKAEAPQQLYFGCRFAWVNPVASAAAARHCDVVSFNIYRRRADDYPLPPADVPVIIGEFHFGALDRGLFHTGLVPVGNQIDRARAYREYVEGVLRHPRFVGCHWFQYQDEPVTGRVYDEENYQIGFVDVTDTPYAETIAASRELGQRLYQTRLAAGQP